MKKLLLPIFTILLLIQSVQGQTIDKEKLKTAKKAIELVQNKNYKEILKLFPDEIGQSIPEKTLIYYVDMGAGFIKEDGIPKDSDLMTKANFMNTKDGMVTVTSITFPFPAPKQQYTMPKKFIEIGFMDKYGDSKIVNLNVRELKPMNMMSDSNTEFQETLDFGVDSIKNWRIYYTKGNINNSNRNVFAVSGKKGELKEMSIEQELKDLFKELKSAKITEKTVLNDIVRYEGKPETISFRWQFEGDNKFYWLSTILNKEKGKSEELNEYLIFSTSVFANEQSIYKIKKSDAPNIVALLKKWSTKDWGDNYEARP